MSVSALTMLGMTAILSALLACLTLAVGFGFLAALGIYAFGGSACLLLVAASANHEPDAFRSY